MFAGLIKVSAQEFDRFADEQDICHRIRAFLATVARKPVFPSFALRKSCEDCPLGTVLMVSQNQYPSWLSYDGHSGLKSPAKFADINTLLKQSMYIRS